MNEDAAGCLVIIGFLAVIFLFVVSTEDGSKKEVAQLTTSASPSTAEAAPVYKNDHGQTVVTVLYEDISKWLQTNKDKKIVAMSAVDKTGYGSTTAFMIVYEEKR